MFARLAHFDNAEACVLGCLSRCGGRMLLAQVTYQGGFATLGNLRSRVKVRDWAAGLQQQGESTRFGFFRWKAPLRWLNCSRPPWIRVRETPYPNG